MADERCPALLHVDSFTRVAFAGNPAAVCLLDAPADATWMGAVAANQNLSETAFMWPTGASEVEGLEGEPARGETFELRWFTPSVEVDLCGHATLAAAHALFSAPGGRESPLLRFGTRSGELVAALRGEGCIELEFPASPPRPLLDGVGPTRGDVALALGLPVDKVVVVGASDDLLVALPDAGAVAALAPDLHAVSRWPYRGLIVTAAGSGSEADFVSRFFGPAVGIPEDPVTGSAHCTLAPYWSGVLGKSTMLAQQLSQRGGELEVEVGGEEEEGASARVWIRGHAVTTLAGELLIPPPRTVPVVSRLC